MKSRSLVTFLSGMAIAVGSTAVFTQPSHARVLAFKCSKPDTQPTTVLYSESSDRASSELTIFKWYQAFPPNRAKQLCNHVSRKLEQQSVNRRGEKVIGFGEVKGKSVLCLTAKTNPTQTCNPNDEILFEFASKENPNLILPKLVEPEMREQAFLPQWVGVRHRNIGPTFFGFSLPKFR